MLTDTTITGLDPFSQLSTFACTGLSIPRGMFLGGCFYTAQPYRAPVHISYIKLGNGDVLSTWGVADATGKELAVIEFRSGSLLAHIRGLDGAYAGCLKARRLNYCGTGITSGGAALSGVGDVSIFLSGLSKDYTLNTDTLVWDISCCSLLATPVYASGAIAKIILPPDCVLTSDTQGCYYMAPDAGITSDSVLQRLRIRGSGGSMFTLSGAHVSIIPRCVSAAVVSSGTRLDTFTESGAKVVTHQVFGSAGDIVGTLVDGAVVMATHGFLAQNE